MRLSHRSRGLTIAPCFLLLGALCGCGGGSGSKNEAPAVWRGFQTPTHYSLSGSPAASLAMVDLNHDSWPDLIAVDSASGQLKLLLGGPGGFHAGPDLTAGTSPIQVAAADFDRDGNSDIAVLEDTTRQISVWFGTGTGTFDTTRTGTYALPARGRRLAVGDVNGDTFPDLAVVSANGSADAVRVSVFLGSADRSGTFTLFWGEHEPMQSIRDIAIRDLNGDNLPDLALAFWEVGEPVWIYPGRGNGTFQDAVRLPTLAIAPDTHDGTNRIFLADLNGDGRTDIVTTHDIGNYQMVAVRPALAAGGFGDAIRLTTDVPEEALTADFDGDTHPDLLVANRASSTLTYFRNTGSGSFAAGQVIPLGGSDQKPTALVSGDFNRDGLLDVAVLNQNQRAVTILYGRG